MRSDHYQVLAGDEPAPSERRLPSLALALTILLACVFYPNLLLDAQGQVDALRTLLAIGAIAAGLIHGLWVER